MGGGIGGLSTLSTKQINQPVKQIKAELQMPPGTR
jgi:hypothetical protein